MTEAAAPGAVVSAVARRWRVRPQQVFAWRREAACAGLAPPSGAAVTGPSVPAFVPILTEAVAAGPVSAAASAPALEIELAGAVVRVAAGADTAQLAAVLRALRASATAA
ncbi:MAG: transposase [Acetobacteraceae bacterium]|nr:transposase [Acetobacteraceae bacterium]